MGSTFGRRGLRDRRVEREISPTCVRQLQVSTRTDFGSAGSDCRLTSNRVDLLFGRSKCPLRSLVVSLSKYHVVDGFFTDSVDIEQLLAKFWKLKAEQILVVRAVILNNCHGEGF